MHQMRINVVVTCTARKTQKAPDGLMMRNIRCDHLGRRFRDWGSRLNKAGVPPKRAVDLYCGNAWSIIRNLSQDTRFKSSVRIWIASAGYGLVPLNQMLKSYNATFVPGKDDSVIPKELARHSVAEWWDLLIERRRKQGADIACITNIAERYPNDPLLVVVSDEYLRAIERDITGAQSMLTDADRLIVVAAGARKTGVLSKNYLPCDSRLENHLGRSRMALNARILNLLLNTFSAREMRAGRLQGYFAKLLATLPKASYPKRKPSDDKVVRQFIYANLRKHSKASYTNFLRLYRSSGRACEQKRFRGLFQKVSAEFLKRK